MVTVKNELNLSLYIPFSGWTVSCSVWAQRLPVNICPFWSQRLVAKSNRILWQVLFIAPACIKHNCTETAFNPPLFFFFLPTASDAGLWCQLGCFQHCWSHELLQVYIQSTSVKKKSLYSEVQQSNVFIFVCCLSCRGLVIWLLHSVSMRALMSSCWLPIKYERSAVLWSRKLFKTFWLLFIF